jgi:hypothetical protein
VENAKAIPISWTAPSFGQTRTYVVWRAQGAFPTLQQVQQNMSAFSAVMTLNGAPPDHSWLDPNVKNKITYTYFVTDANKQGATSGASFPLVVTPVF